MKIKIRAILLFDLITQPITRWLAFEEQLKEIGSLMPPKESKENITLIRKLAKGIPGHNRGAFLYDIFNLIYIKKRSAIESIAIAFDMWIDTNDKEKQ